MLDPSASAEATKFRLLERRDVSSLEYAIARDAMVLVLRWVLMLEPESAGPRLIAAFKSLEQRAGARWCFLERSPWAGGIDAESG